MLAFFAPGVQAQELAERPENILNYAYSALLGTGFYEVGDRQVGVLEAPFNYQLREAGDDARFGIKILLPVAIGINDFSTSDLFPDDPDDIATLSFVPGIELQVPVGEKWLVRPFGQLGYGTDLGSSESAVIYTVGVKARYEFSELTIDQPGITIGTSLIAAGYSPDNANSDNLGLGSFGFDVRFPQRWRMGGHRTWLGLSVYGNYYFSEAEFRNIFEDPSQVRNELTLALALGGAPEFEVLGVPFERIGIGYKRGDGIRAITLVTNFPF